MHTQHWQEATIKTLLKPRLLERLFDGCVAPLVAQFSQQRKLSRKDIAELRKLLDGIDAGGDTK